MRQRPGQPQEHLLRKVLHRVAAAEQASQCPENQVLVLFDEFRKIIQGLSDRPCGELFHLFPVE